MATTQNTYTGNGTNKLFSITFPYLDRSDIDVYLNGTLQTITTQYTFANATTVEFVTAPANGAAVLIDRSTNDATLQATFFPGSSIKASDLNDNFDQVLYIAQETANNAANQNTTGLQAQITAATNTANTAIVTANAADATANAIAGTANTALSNSSAAVITANSANVTATNADITANATSATANTALTNANAAQTTANSAQTTANAALPKAGGTMTGVITYATAQPRLVAETFIPSTSGTAIEFPGLPSWTKRITVMFNGVSTSGGSPIIVQLGTGSGPTYATSGYLGSVLLVDANVSTAGTSFTTGFLVTYDSANGHVRHGNITITNVTGNTWTQTGLLAQSDSSATKTHHSAGSIALAAPLTAVNITTVNGSNTFDLGSINILYEG